MRRRIVSYWRQRLGGKAAAKEPPAASKSMAKSTAEPAPARLQLPAPAPEPVKLERIYPPLDERDAALGALPSNSFTEDEIVTALALLRGGPKSAQQRRVTRPARFQIALRHVQGFAQMCLALKAKSAIRAGEMYTGYLVWAQEQGMEAVPSADFDFAMADYVGHFGGIRNQTGYSGCAFKPDFMLRLAEVRDREIKRRLGQGLENLMTGPRK